MESTKPLMIRPISMSSINIGMRQAWNRTPDGSGVLSPVTYADLEIPGVLSFNTFRTLQFEVGM
jgi:hypothetical protein